MAHWLRPLPNDGCMAVHRPPCKVMNGAAARSPAWESLHAGHLLCRLGQEFHTRAVLWPWACPGSFMISPFICTIKMYHQVPMFSRPALRSMPIWTISRPVVTRLDRYCLSASACQEGWYICLPIAGHTCYKASRLPSLRPGKIKARFIRTRPVHSWDLG